MDDQLKPLSDLAKYAGTTADYLRFLIFKNKLRGEKIGKIWFSKKEWVDEYKNALNKGNNGSVDSSVKQGSNELVSELLTRIEHLEKEAIRRNQPILRHNGFETLQKFMMATATLLTFVWLTFFVVENRAEFAGFVKSFTKPIPSFFNASVLAYKNNSPLAIILQENDLKDIFPKIFNKQYDFSLPKFSKLYFLLPNFKFSSFSTLSFSKISPPSFSLPSFHSLTSLLHELLAPLEIGRLKTTVKSLMGFSSPSSSTSEIPISITPVYEVESRFSGISEPHELSETRFSGIEPRKVSSPIPAESGTKQSSSNTSSISSQLFSSLATLNQKLREEFFQTTNDLNNRISTLGDKQTSQSRIITLTQKIDQLDGQTLKNITFQGTANQFNLKDADIPDDISISGNISPTQLTVSKTLTVSGTGTSTYSGGIQATTLNITSTTATSTFSNGIQLGGGALKTLKEVV